MAGPSTPMALAGQEQNQSNYQPCDMSSGDVALYLDEIGVQRLYISTIGSLPADCAVIGPPYPGATFEIDDSATRNGHTLHFRTPLGVGVVVPVGVRCKVVCKADGSDYVFAAGGTGGGTGSGTTADGIIFKPGVASSGNHVATWAEVKTAINAANGALTVYCDDSLAPCVVDVGVTDCFGLVSLGVKNVKVPSILNLPEGAILLNLARIRTGLHVVPACTTSPNLVYNYAVNNILQIEEAASIVLDATCTHSPIEVAAGDTFTIFTSGTLDASPAAPGTCVIALDAFSSVTIINESNPDLFIGTDCVKGAAGSQLNLGTDVSASSIPNQPNFLGTLSVQRTSFARYISPSQGNLAGRPTDPVVGQMYFDTTLDCAEWWDGANWVGQQSSPQIIVFAVGLATASSVKTLPASWFMLDVKVQIVTPYTAGATMTVGQTASPASFAAAADINLQGAAGDIFDFQQFTAGVANPVKATIAGGPAVGAANVIATYVISPQS